MSRRTSQIRLYPNSFPREGPDGVEFHSPDPVVFMMWPMESLGDLLEDSFEEYEASRAYTRDPNGEDSVRSSDGSVRPDLGHVDLDA
ncbi:hypothetical protein PIB30_052362 [Stylosanthes scabra]|uniref:Uncharacterized protein n=1 Tax=Stylosanthes scabra TaxID=79078 RepID=A0ABU6TK61_9FABA|nr:hypothetical protein [Stylosanthes scabra]